MMFRKLLVSSKNILSKKHFSTEIQTPLLINEYLSGRDKGIVVIGLNHYKTKNAFSKQLTEALNSAFDAISTDSNTRILIIRSTVPKVFCAGADLKERLSMVDHDVKVFVSSLRNLMLKLENLPIPVIAAINGAALGGGLELALACDMRVASESSRLGLVETKLAIIPGAGGTQRLPRIIGLALSKELIFTGRIINGKTAKEYGLINHVTIDGNGHDSAYQKALEIAREILPNGPIGVTQGKKAINLGSHVDIYEGCSIEETCYDKVIPTKDRIEGLKAFIEKRRPIYSGE